MSNKNVTVTVEPSLPVALFIVFLVLKLTDVIAWSWWWVTAPLWIPFALFIIFALIFAIVAVIKSGGSSRKIKKRRADAWNRINK